MPLQFELKIFRYMLLIPEASTNKYKTIPVASDFGCTNLGPLYTLANGHDCETVSDLKNHPKAVPRGNVVEICMVMGLQV